MAHIGIVNITTIGACICANEIAAESARLGNHPEFTMHAFSFIRYKELVLNQDWSTLAKLILESIQLLKKSGADFIIIPLIPPIMLSISIQKNSPLPVINLIEVVTNECVKKKYTQVAVLGTKFTMQGGLYDKLLRDRKIMPVIPNTSICEKIHNLIMDEIIPSKIKPASVEQVKTAIKSLNCDAAILGCTELPEVYDEKGMGIPLLDSTRLLAHYALEFARNLDKSCEAKNVQDSNQFPLQGN